MTTYRGFRPLAQALERAASPKVVRAAIRRPYSRLLTKGRREIQDRLKREGITGGIARRRKVKRGDKQINVRVKRPRVARNGIISGGYEASGLVAIQEEGGKIRPHRITARRGGVLKFAGRGGPTYRRTVLHPGARVRKRPVIADTLEGLKPRLTNDIEASLHEALAKVIG